MPLTTKLGQILLPRRSITSFDDIKLVVVDRDKCRIGRSTFYTVAPTVTAKEDTADDGEVNTLVYK